MNQVQEVQEVQEQIQEDIRTYLDEQPEYIIDELCDIVIRNMARLKNNL